MNGVSAARSVAVLDARPGSGADLLGFLLWHRAVGSGHALVHITPFGLSDGLMKTFSLVPAEQQSLDGSEQAIITDACLGCGSCALMCRFGAVQRTRFNGNTASHRTPWHIVPLNCAGCGVCARFCPSSAIVMRRPVVGTLQISRHQKTGSSAVSILLEPGRDITDFLVARAIREGKNRRTGDDANLFITGLSATSPVAPGVCAEAEILIFAIPPIPGAERFIDRAAGIATGAGRRACVVVTDSDRNVERARTLEVYSRGAGLEPSGLLPSCATCRAAEMHGANAGCLTSDLEQASSIDTLLDIIR